METKSNSTNFCYVCGPDSAQPFIDRSNERENIINVCNEVAAEKEKFKCPKGFRGCITKIDRKWTIYIYIVIICIHS